MGCQLWKLDRPVPLEPEVDFKTAEPFPKHLAPTSGTAVWNVKVRMLSELCSLPVCAACDRRMARDESRAAHTQACAFAIFSSHCQLSSSNDVAMPPVSRLQDRQSRFQGQAMSAASDECMTSMGELLARPHDWNLLTVCHETGSRACICLMLSSTCFQHPFLTSHEASQGSPMRATPDNPNRETPGQ